MTHHPTDSSSRNGRSLTDYLNPREPIPAGVYVGLGVASLGFVLSVWSIVTYWGFISALFLPPPHRVLLAGIEQFTQFGFATDIFMSTYRVLAGFFLAAAMGVPLGLLMGTFKAVEALIEPLVGFIRYMPASEFIPLIIVWSGLGQRSKMAIIFIGAFFPLVLMVAGRGVAQLLTDGQIITFTDERMAFLGNGHLLGLVFGVLVLFVLAWRHGH